MQFRSDLLATEGKRETLGRCRMRKKQRPRRISKVIELSATGPQIPPNLGNALQHGQGNDWPPYYTLLTAAGLEMRRSRLSCCTYTVVSISACCCVFTSTPGGRQSRYCFSDLANETTNKLNLEITSSGGVL